MGAVTEEKIFFFLDLKVESYLGEREPYSFVKYSKN